MSAPRQPGAAILCAAALLCVVLGSVHAFSVFIEPLEARFGASRAAVSATYSLALLCLTAAVLFGHRVYARAPAWGLMLVSAGLAAAGALVAGWAPSLPVTWLGYSLLFGAANGLGYGFGLQIAARANPGREGLAMGIVTAAYALGAVLAPPGFAAAMAVGGVRAAMVALALCLVLAGGVSALLMRRAGARFRPPAPNRAGAATRGVLPLWLGYFGGVMAGLMVIGHAAGIAAAVDPARAAWIAPAVIAACNLLGSMAGGRAADRLAPRALMTLLPALTMLALIGLAGLRDPAPMLVALGLAGFAYGGTIAAYPAVIAKRVGMQDSARVYGRVFTAWGAAGLAGPWMAGALFDLTGTYLAAMVVAAAIGALSVAVAWRAFQPG